MKIIKLLEEKFWIPICLALLFGLFLPQFGLNLSFLVIPILIIVFFLTCLKINIHDVAEQIKKPKFIIYILILYLLVIPAVLYAAFQFISPEIGIGILLLSSMPPGVASVFITDIFDGNMSVTFQSY